MKDEFERLGCEDMGSEACEEAMDEAGLDLEEESRKHFREFDENW